MDYPGDPEPARVMIGSWFPGIFKKGSGKTSKKQERLPGYIAGDAGSSIPDKTKKGSCHQHITRRSSHGLWPPLIMRMQCIAFFNKKHIVDGKKITKMTGVTLRYKLITWAMFITSRSKSPSSHQGGYLEKMYTYHQDRDPWSVTKTHSPLCISLKNRKREKGIIHLPSLTVNPDVSSASGTGQGFTAGDRSARGIQCHGFP